MNYRKQYDLLIFKHGKPKRQNGEYAEKHHIIPKSLGGQDLNNTVYLSARAHYLAHWLLWKIHGGRKMALAFKRMCEAPKHNGRVKITGKGYEIAKKALSESMAGVKRPDLVGERNPMRRPEIAKKISDSKKEYWKDKREYAARAASKSYEVTNPEGVVTLVHNLKQFCVDNHLNYSSLLYAAKTGGNPSRAKGYNCKGLTTLCE